MYCKALYVFIYVKNTYTISYRDNMYECVYISIGYLNHKGKQERVRVTYTLLSHKIYI